MNGLERIARLRALQNGKDQCQIAGKTYTKKGAIRLIDDLINYGHLPGPVRASLGKAKRGMLEDGDSPKKYEPTISNAYYISKQPARVYKGPNKNQRLGLY